MLERDLLTVSSDIQTDNRTAFLDTESPVADAEHERHQEWNANKGDPSRQVPDDNLRRSGNDGRLPERLVQKHRT